MAPGWHLGRLALTLRRCAEEGPRSRCRADRAGRLATTPPPAAAVSTVAISGALGRHAGDIFLQRLRTGHVAIAADVGRKARIGGDVRSWSDGLVVSRARRACADRAGDAPDKALAQLLRGAKGVDDLLDETAVVLGGAGADSGAAAGCS